jgi:hypothetical protein
VKRNGAVGTGAIVQLRLGRTMDMLCWSLVAELSESPTEAAPDALGAPHETVE